MAVVTVPLVIFMFSTAGKLGSRGQNFLVDGLEVRLRNPDCAQRFVAIMYTPQRLQVCFVETLDSDRKAIHAGCAKIAKFFCFKGTGVGFQCDFGIRFQRHAGAHGGEDVVEAACGKNARRATAEKNRVHAPAPDFRQGVVEIGNERVDVLALLRYSLLLVAVEIAVRALADAPGNMDILILLRTPASVIWPPGTRRVVSSAAVVRTSSRRRCFWCGCSPSVASNASRAIGTSPKLAAAAVSMAGKTL